MLFKTIVNRIWKLCIYCTVVRSKYLALLIGLLDFPFFFFFLDKPFFLNFSTYKYMNDKIIVSIYLPIVFRIGSLDMTTHVNYICVASNLTSKSIKCFVRSSQYDFNEVHSQQG